VHPGDDDTLVGTVGDGLVVAVRVLDQVRARAQDERSRMA
jgi:hypothetical protein